MNMQPFRLSWNDCSCGMGKRDCGCTTGGVYGFGKRHDECCLRTPYPTENNPYNSNWDQEQSSSGSFKYGIFECFKSDMPCECCCVASICLFGHYNCLCRYCILNL